MKCDHHSCDVVALGYEKCAENSITFCSRNKIHVKRLLYALLLSVYRHKHTRNNINREPDKRGNKFQMIHCYKSSADEKQFPFCSRTQKILKIKRDECY